MVSEFANRVNHVGLEANESVTALPPRRERHRKTSVRKKSAYSQERQKKNITANPPIRDGFPRENRLSRQDSKRNSKEASQSEELKQKNERKGSVIVANIIFCGFLILVGSILFYTIRYYS